MLMALLAFFVLYLVLSFVWRGWVVYRRSGTNPFVLGAADDAYGYVGRCFKLCLLAMLGVLTAQAFGLSASWLDTAWPATPALRTGLAALGWVMLLGSLVLIVLAQQQMGLSWRVGIDPMRHTDLVTHGVFAHSRNPIFLSMRLGLLGWVCVAPSTASVVLAVAGEVLMQLQVRLEEAHLRGLHGPRYQAYCARVRRWL